MSQNIRCSNNHRNQARHNRVLLSENCFPDPCSSNILNYKDWNVTVLFYTALHYVQSYLWKNRSLGYRIRFLNHTDRNNYLSNLSNTDSKIAVIVDDYVALFKASCISRYNPCSFNQTSQNDICDYAVFALNTLPQTLGVI
jgi:hypothetical protein